GSPALRGCFLGRARPDARQADPHRPYGAGRQSDLCGSRRRGARRRSQEPRPQGRCRRRRRDGAGRDQPGSLTNQEGEGDMKRFTDRVAIVTGAAQGIGAAIARRLGQEGATVVVADVNEKAAAKVAKACGNKSFAVATDVGDASEVKKLHATVVKRAGKIDVLVNNAAIVPFQPWD